MFLSTKDITGQVSLNVKIRAMLKIVQNDINCSVGMEENPQGNNRKVTVVKSFRGRYLLYITDHIDFFVLEKGFFRGMRFCAKIFL